MERKDELSKVLLEKTRALEKAITDEDVPTLIDAILFFKVDTRRYSALEEYCKKIIVEFIKNFIVENGVPFLKIKRLGIYKEWISDFYKLENGTVFRNHIDVKFSSLSRLYQAYNAIKDNNYEIS